VKATQNTGLPWKKILNFDSERSTLIICTIHSPDCMDHVALFHLWRVYIIYICKYDCS